MRYLTLACDYDGTIATRGVVTEQTVAALQRVHASGRKLVLVTGRQLEDLLAIFPHVHLFERVVAENGALLYRPASREEKVLATAPPEEFCWALRDRGVWPLSIRRVVVATQHPHETTVLDAIRQLGLELQVIFNKGAVMVLPSGVNKATGLVAALAELSLSPHNIVGIGDAENDHAFLRLCECAAAVGNALPMLQDQADYVTHGVCGAGVEELIEQLVADDLRSIAPRLTRHHILLGIREDVTDDTLPPYGENILLAGSSGGGKSTFAVGFLERLAARQYQFCVVDPEGDYETLDPAVALGNPQRPPSVDEVLQLLESPENNAVINLVGLPLSDRPGFFHALFPRLQELRARTGRPHWILVDEAHHLLAAAWEPAGMALSQAFTNMMFITVHPRLLAPGVLAAIDLCVAVGQSPLETLQELSEAVKQAPPEPVAARSLPDEVLVWRRKTADAPYWLRPRRAARSGGDTAASTPKARSSRNAAFISAVLREHSICARKTCCSFNSWPKASTTPPGCTTCDAAIIRAGFATLSRMKRWRRRGVVVKQRQPPVAKPRRFKTGALVFCARAALGAVLAPL